MGFFKNTKKNEINNAGMILLAGFAKTRRIMNLMYFNGLIWMTSKTSLLKLLQQKVKKNSDC